MSHGYLKQIATENGLGPAAEIYVIKYSVSGVISISDGNWRMLTSYFNFKTPMWTSMSFEKLKISGFVSNS